MHAMDGWTLGTWLWMPAFVVMAVLLAAAVGSSPKK